MIKIAYVLENKEGLYVKFQKGKSPILVKNIYEASQIEDKVKAINKMTAIPRRFGKFEPTFIDDKNEIIKIDKTMSVQEIQKIIAHDMKIINGNIKCLKDRLLKIELLNIDIQHFIEFNNLNASDGYKIYKIFHELRVQRRKIKNQISDMEQIRVTTISDISSMQQMEDKHRIYECRNSISKPLFEGKISNDYKKICEKIKEIN